MTVADADWSHWDWWFEVAARISAGEAQRGVVHVSSGPALQQNLVAVLEGEDR